MKKLALFISLCLVGLASYSTSPVSGNTKDKTPVNFAKHIAPIFQNRCEECHRAGGVAPMPLATSVE